MRRSRADVLSSQSAQKSLNSEHYSSCLEVIFEIEICDEISIWLNNQLKIHNNHPISSGPNKKKKPCINLDLNLYSQGFPREQKARMNLKLRFLDLDLIALQLRNSKRVLLYLDQTVTLCKKKRISYF